MNLSIVLFASFLLIGLASGNPRFRRDADGLIVGGVESSIEDNPWQVSLRYNSNHRCGGIIIGDSWILTAAHCTDGLGSTLFSVRVGSSYYESGGSVIEIDEVYEHKDGNLFSLDYDFALLKLAEPLTFSDKVQPIALPDADTVVPDGAVALISGWGNTRHPNESREKIRKAEVPIVDQEECKRAYAGIHEVTDRMICAGYEKGGKDSCQGDSGGPLSYIGSDGVRVVIGVVSWGYGCAEAYYPGVYGRVTSVREWINDVTGL